MSTKAGYLQPIDGLYFHPKHLECAFCNSEKTNILACSSAQFFSRNLWVFLMWYRQNIYNASLYSQGSIDQIIKYWCYWNASWILFVLNNILHLRPCLFHNFLCIPLAMFSCSFIHSLAEICYLVVMHDVIT